VAAGSVRPIVKRVIPAKAGIHLDSVCDALALIESKMGSGFRRDDGWQAFHASHQWLFQPEDRRMEHTTRSLVALGLLLSLLNGIAFASDADDAGVAGKLDPAIKCINSHSHWVLKSRERYLSWIKSAESGPTGKEAVIYGLYKLHDVGTCRAGIEAVLGKSPAMPEFEQAMQAWLQAFATADAVITEADTYYELQNYNDDRMQLGKALHPRLLAAYADFERADDALRTQLESIKDGLTERRLERLAADPALRTPYLAERALREADLMLRSASGLGSKAFNAAPFAARVAALEVAWRELGEHRKASPDDRSDVVRSSSFENAVFALLKSAKAAERRTRDGFRLDESEQMLADNGAAQLVDGHPTQLLEKYNGLIDVANRARW